MTQSPAAQYEQLGDPLALTVFIATLLLPVAVGFLAIRGSRSEEGFHVGGRSMNRFLVALSAVSSGRSSWLVLGLAGIAYVKGVTAVWAVAGYVVVEMFQFILVGRRLRRETGTRSSLTLLDYFEHRFDRGGSLLRVTGAAIITLFMTAYVAAQFNAAAKSLEAATALDFELGLLASAVLVLVYMVMGGFVAVVYNDAIRAGLMLLGLVVLPAAAIIRLGGLDILLHALDQLDPRLLDPWAFGWGVVVAYLGIGLGSPGQPHILARYMSIDDPANLRLSAVVGTVWNVVLGWGAVFVGLAGRAFFPDPSSLPLKGGEGDPETAFLMLSSELFGPLFYGLLVGGLFAAILSTVDSQLLVVSSTIVQDIYAKVIRKGREPGEARALRLSRLVLVACGAAACLLAWGADELVFWLVLFAWGGLGAALGPALILSLWWRRTTRWGIFAGMVTGTVVIFAWYHWLKEATGLYELVPAFFLALLAALLVSSLTSPAAEDRG